MNGLAIGVASGGCIFSGTLIGLTLRKFLPEHHLSSDSHDAVKLGAGMISLMAALVLGLLVSSAKSTFDGANQAITETGAKVILMDRLLANYGPETKEIRQDLRAAVARSIAMLWPEEPPTAAMLQTFERGTAMEQVLEKVRALKPPTESQRALQGRVQDLGHDILLTRWMQIEQAQVSLPLPFLLILLFWLTMLYMTFGLFAPRNGTVIATMFVGALALATAVFLIVEMSHPLQGAMKVSSGPIRKALEHLSR
jgi:hypothetical protein